MVNVLMTALITVLMWCCLCWCIDDCVIGWCDDVLLCKSVDALMALCWCVEFWRTDDSVLMCWGLARCLDDCVDVLMTCVTCWSIDLLMCWWHCVDVLMTIVLVCWCDKSENFTEIAVVCRCHLLTQDQLLVADFDVVSVRVSVTVTIIRKEIGTFVVWSRSVSFRSQNKHLTSY
jgi:hypothetical protein